jgi:cellulose synthase/poly-beta-1,6-N-acetylglucosamine synthase-like glycosyltransferase
VTHLYLMTTLDSTVLCRILLVACVGVVFYTYAGYPALLLLISAFCRRRKSDLGYCPSISVLIAAYNEEKSIEEKIEQTLALDYPADKLEIIVLSDCSRDGTDQIVRSFRDPRVRLLRMRKRRGKTHAQNEGVKAAKGEIIVFSDATTVYHSQALRYLACNYQDPTVGAVTGRNRYFDPDGNSPTGLGTVAFWNYENLIKTMQSRIHTLSGCVGCIYSVRKCVYKELPDDVISDLVQPLWVIQKGYRVVFEGRAWAYEETTNSTAQEFSMRIRVVTRGMRGLLSVPELLKPWNYGWTSFQLYSHKVLRWLVPIFLIGAFVSSLLTCQTHWVRNVLALQAAFYAAALLTVVFPTHRTWKPLTIPLYFCTLNAAALVGLVQLLRGRKYVVWETVRKGGRRNAPIPVARKRAKVLASSDRSGMLQGQSAQGLPWVGGALKARVAEASRLGR